MCVSRTWTKAKARGVVRKAMLGDHVCYQNSQDVVRDWRMGVKERKVSRMTKGL